MTIPVVDGCKAHGRQLQGATAHWQLAAIQPMGLQNEAFYISEAEAPGGSGRPSGDQNEFRTVWGNYGELIDRVEQELCDIQGLEDPAREKHCGRKEGQQLVWKNVAGQKASSTGSRTNPVSRAWRLSQVWLARIIAAVETKEAGSGAITCGIMSTTLKSTTCA